MNRHVCRVLGSTAIIAASACAGLNAEDPRPAAIRWNATAAETQAALAGRCLHGFTTRRIDPPFLPDLNEGQIQIDCDGLEFLGMPREAEFVIGDDRLQMVWILVPPNDEARVLAELTRAYGAPTSATDDYVVFEQGEAAWRYSPTEVLYYSPALQTWLDPWFDGGE